MKATIAVFVAKFAVATMNQTFTTAVRTGSLGSISVDVNSAVVIEQGKNMTKIIFLKHYFPGELKHVVCSRE